MWRVTHDAGASWFGWASVALSVPFVFQAFTAYPDGFGGAIVILGIFVAVLGCDASARLLFAGGAALVALPWLHTRFALTAAAIGLIVVARQIDAPDRIRRIIDVRCRAGGWRGGVVLVFLRGLRDPQPGRAVQRVHAERDSRNIPRGVAGLLFDQQFGLLPNAPVYLCAFAGFVPLTRRQPRCRRARVR